MRIDEVENRLLGMLSKAETKIVEALRAVVARIPEDDRYLLFDERNVHFVLPEFSKAERIVVPPPSPTHNPRDLCTVWLVCLNHNLPKKKKAERIYVIAHELAHVFLEHWGGELDSGGIKELNRRAECSADEQVIKWGFKKELLSSPNNYLFGNGLKSMDLE